MNSTTRTVCLRISVFGAVLWSGFGSASFASGIAKTGYSWQRTDSSVALMCSKQVVWQLNYNHKEGQPYFHPLAVEDGMALTSLRPADHPWHKALWFSWKYINGVNYWDPEEPEGRTEVLDVNVRAGADYSARVEMGISYHLPQRPAVLTEKRTLTVSAPDEKGSYRIDWLSIFTAGANDVLLDRTPIPGEEKGKSYGGYAGLSLRMAEYAKGWRFLGSEGPLEPEGRGIKSRWADFCGRTAKDGLAGVAVFDHPDNPRHPSSWWLSASMPYFSPAYLFHTPYTLPAGKTLTLRYRILVHTGRADRDMLESEWKAFAALQSWRGNFTKTDYSYRAVDIAGLRKGFEKPPMEAGPWVYWFCFDNAITKEEMEREIEEMVAEGIAGAELRFVEFAWWRKKEVVDKDLELAHHKRLEYLSDEFVDVLAHACSVAERHSFKLSINMGMGWPPGGTWITDEYRTRKLQSKATVVEGPKRIGEELKIGVPQDGKVYAWQLDEGKDKGVLAGSFVDLTGRVRAAGKEGSLFWNAPEGRWLICTFRLGYGGGLDKAYGYPADPGSEKAIRFHLNYLFDKIEPKLGRYFGTTLTEVASDSWEYDGRPYWTPGMDEMFAKLYGYELAPRMYALAGYGEDREQILADIDRTEQQLVLENFFICAREVLNAHGLCHRPQAYGRGLSRDLFEAYSNCDVPEIEEGVYCPEAVWVSHTLGKPITSVEGMTFMSRHVNDVIHPVFGDEQKAYGIDETRGAWETNPAMLRWFSNAHYARGINRVQMHGFGYSPDGVPLPGWRMYAEIHLNRNVPWWRYMKEYSAWARRIQWVLQSGGPVADVLVYPIEGDRGDGPHNKRGEQQPISAMNCVDAASTYTFSRIWESDDSRYEVKNLCLLGDIKTLEEAEKIDKMIKRGAKVTYCGVEPEKWTVFGAHKGPAVDGLLESMSKARERGTIVDGRKEGWKRVVLSARSVQWYPEEAVLTYLHRRVEGGKVYFVTNCGAEFNGEVEFGERGLVPEIWDADTGKKTVCGQWRLCDGKVRVKVRLGHLESVVIVFAEGRPVLHVTECEGADIIRGEDGKLYALPAGGQTFRILLSDGRVKDLNGGTRGGINLDEGWTLRASDGDGVGVKGKVDIQLDKLKSWRQISELRKYSGTGTYEISFDVGAEMLRDDLVTELDLGRVYEVADVWLNGRRVGVSWYPPYRVDVTGLLRKGQNELRVDVTNILKNYLAEGEYSHPSGLLGPVKIRGISKLLLSE